LSEQRSTKTSIIYVRLKLNQNDTVKVTILTLFFEWIETGWNGSKITAGLYTD